MAALQLASPRRSRAISTRPPPACSAWTLPADGQYGALSVSELTTLDGGLAIELTGFTLGKGDTFDILTFGSLPGGFDTLTLDGAACKRRPWIRGPAAGA